MLDKGFEKQILPIDVQIRPDRQTIIFTATWLSVEDVEVMITAAAIRTVVATRMTVMSAAIELVVTSITAETEANPAAATVAVVKTAMDAMVALAVTVVKVVRDMTVSMGSEMQSLETACVTLNEMTMCNLEYSGDASRLSNHALSRYKYHLRLHASRLIGFNLDTAVVPTCSTFPEISVWPQQTVI